MERSLASFAWTQLLRACPVLVSVLAAGFAGIAITQNRRSAAEHQRASVAALHAFFDGASLRNAAVTEDPARPDALGYVRTTELKDSLNEPPPLVVGAQASAPLAETPAAPRVDPAENARRAEWGLPPLGKQAVRKPQGGAAQSMAGMLGGFGGGAMRDLLGAAGSPAAAMLGPGKLRSVGNRRKGGIRRGHPKMGKRLVARHYL